MQQINEDADPANEHTGRCFSQYSNKFPWRRRFQASGIMGHKSWIEGTDLSHCCCLVPLQLCHMNFLLLVLDEVNNV